MKAQIVRAWYLNGQSYKRPRVVVVNKTRAAISKSVFAFIKKDTATQGKKTVNHTRTERQVIEFDLSITMYENQIISSQIVIDKAN